MYILAQILPVYSIKISGRTFWKKRIEIISGTFGPGSAYIERIIYICVINLNYKFIISDILFIVLVPATSSLRKEMPFVEFFFFNSHWFWIPRWFLRETRLYVRCDLKLKCKRRSDTSRCLRLERYRNLSRSLRYLR